MKLSFLQSIALAGLLGCCSGSRADGSTSGTSLRPATAAKATLLPIRSSVVVREVSGYVEYAYDSTGWKQLVSGKTLRPGATVRAASGATATLRIADAANYFRVSASTQVHLTAEAPVEENETISVAALSAPRASLAD